jgi:HD superfamily phosphohydrolase
MDIPDRLAAARLLLRLEPPDWFLAHSGGVAEVATFLAGRVETTDVSVEHVAAAALLHDVDRLFPADHELAPLGHGRAGAAWLEREGHGELAAAVAAHPLQRLSGGYEGWAQGLGLAERIVAYADKRVAQDLVTVDERLDDMARRHPRHEAAIRAARPAVERLEQEICAACGLRPMEVRREPWVAVALNAARRAA